MKKNMGQSSAVRFLITAAAFVIVVAGMRAASPVLIPFLLSIFIAIICAPLLFWLKGKGMPTALAILIVVVLIVAIGVGVAAMVGTSLDDFSRSLPLYQERLKAKTTDLLSLIERLGIDVSDQKFLDVFNPGAAMKFFAGMLSSLGGMLTNGFLILLTVIFILLEASSLPGKLHAILKDPEISLGHFNAFISNVQRYMALKTWVSLGTGVAVTIWLTVIGVDYPLLWGLLAFLFNYVPNIGSILAAVPAVLLALIQLGVGSALLSVLGYVVVNVTVGNIIEPKIMGRGLGLSTLVVFLSLVFWGWVFGPVGMLLSVPLTMTLTIALGSSEDTRWIAVLLGSESHPMNESDVQAGEEYGDRPES